MAERIHDPADHRRTLVRLTPAGEAARRETEAMLRAYMVRVIRRMGEENFAAMLDSWRRWGRSHAGRAVGPGRPLSLRF